MPDYQAALLERDKIIQELTTSLKESIEIRDRLNERNESLIAEAKRLDERKKWITDRHFDEFEPRLSETTIDLVNESDFEDDEPLKKTAIPTETSDLRSEYQPIDQLNAPNVLNPTIDEFKKSLAEVEAEMFNRIELRFQEMLNEKLNNINEKLQQERMEKAELDSETNRLKQLLVNLKNGSTEVVELRSELDKIHKKEMENLRLYFERKCTDLEKQ